MEDPWGVCEDTVTQCLKKKKPELNTLAKVSAKTHRVVKGSSSAVSEAR